jgi:hypothetical protein
MSTLTLKMQSLAAALATHYPQRIVTRDWEDSSQRNDSDLTRGIYTLISKSETDYADYPGREAQLGTLQFVLIAQIKVAEASGASTVEDAESDLIDEIKAFVSSPPPSLADAGNLALVS